MASETLKRIVPIDAMSLGMIRALICGFALLDILLINFADFGRLPTTVMRPTGAMQLIPWRFYDALFTPQGMMVLKLLMIVSFLGAALGFFTAITTKSAAVLFLFYQGLVRSFGVFSHDEMVVVYILIALAFTPCGDGFSIDSYLGRVKTRPAGIVYGYPILLMRTLLAWSYFSSALIKLRVTGLRYFSPDNLPTAAIWHSLDNFHQSQFRFAFWLPKMRGSVTTALVIIVLLWELVFPLAIFSKFARRLILPFAVVFHASTALLMNIWFPYHLIACAIFLDWHKLYLRISNTKIFEVLTRPWRSLSTHGAQ